MVFAVALPSSHGAPALRWSRSIEFADLALAGREIEARGGQAWQPPFSLLSPSVLCPASSLKPTNGTSAQPCFPQPQTPAKLAGLATFTLKCWAPFWVRLKPTWQPPPCPPPHPTLSVWVAGIQAGSSPEQKESAGSGRAGSLGWLTPV